MTVIERADGGWQQRECRAGEDVALDDPPLRFGVDELYAGIELEDDTALPSVP